ncbi:hypothetical protein BH11PSE9_BH11PSE9_38390 [soil metagenome]
MRTLFARRGGALRSCLSILFLVFGLACVGSAVAAPSTSNFVEDMTWTERHDRLAAGATTVLVPIGGVEQSGPHMALGKHNVRARVLASRIAQKLGNAVVAPVVAYVPEGSIEPPAGHMKFTGTISVPDATFEALLEATARSFCQHGFKDVFFLGDHGGYQQNEERAAARLNKAWAARPACRAHALLDYYRVTQTEFVKALEAKGFGADEIGVHAGLADTALSLAIDPAMVRPEQMARAAKAGPREGVHGDPRRATAELGQLGIDRVIETSVAQIKAQTARAR